MFYIALFLVPKPPRNMTIEKTTTNSVIVQWVAPTDSLVSEYAIRYRTESEGTWERLPAVQITEAEVTDMTPGEKYTIQVNTVSYGLESNEPQQLNHTVRKYHHNSLRHPLSDVVTDVCPHTVSYCTTSRRLFLKNRKQKTKIW